MDTTKHMPTPNTQAARELPPMDTRPRLDHTPRPHGHSPRAQRLALLLPPRRRAMTWRVCSKPGCGTLHTGRGQCPNCRAAADRRRRPNGNPYATRGHQAFREQVLARDPICVICLSARSTVADHDPLDREQLVARGLDPNDPKHGRGLCKRCHDRKTAREHGFGAQATTL